MQAFVTNARHLWSDPRLPWMILLFGLSVLIVALGALILTRWGQSNPLRKCVVLSLFVHLLLVGYATTVQIVTVGAGGHGPIGMILSDGDADFGSDAAQPNDKNSTFDTIGSQAMSVPTAIKPERLDVKPPAVDPSRVADELKKEDKAKPLPVPALLASTIVKPDKTAPVAAPPEFMKPTPAIKAIDEAISEARAEPSKISPTPPAPATPERLSVDPPAAQASPAPSADAPIGTSNPLSNLVPVVPFAEGAHRSLPGPPGMPETPKVSALKPASNANSQTTASNGSATPASPGASGATPPSASGASDAPHVVPDLYQNRLSANRGALLRRSGGSAQSEAAVQLALKWLATAQSPGGYWDADRYGAGQEMMVHGQDRHGAGANADSGMTGLALLAMLGAGNTHRRDGPYKANVQRGIDYLLSIQRQDGNLGGGAELYALMYSHGIATLALSESFGMTGDRRLEQPMRAAIGCTLAAQHLPTGSWRYQVMEPGDTSQLGWQLMALKSAEMAGVQIPQQNHDAMIRFLKNVSSGAQGGLASYRPNEQVTRTMTAEALVCRQFLGMARENPACDEAGNFLLGDLPRHDRINLYYWYYGSLGMYQLQGAYWQRWNEAVQNTLVARQMTDGELAGSWNPDCIWGGYGGRVYSTSLATLCLEVYYRYLPLYARSLAKREQVPSR